MTNRCERPSNGAQSLRVQPISSRGHDLSNAVKQFLWPLVCTRESPDNVCHFPGLACSNHWQRNLGSAIQKRLGEKSQGSKSPSNVGKVLRIERRERRNATTLHFAEQAGVLPAHCCASPSAVGQGLRRKRLNVLFCGSNHIRDELGLVIDGQLHRSHGPQGVGYTLGSELTQLLVGQSNKLLPLGCVTHLSQIQSLLLGPLGDTMQCGRQIHSIHLHAEFTHHRKHLLCVLQLAQLLVQLPVSLRS
mmetsp:Transcript_8006/g.18909  ORF Transcript_8006/g.18909 Transcript_8006/m.18909 type:complete len:247 (-) Transcript_8006:574-1314(-)